MKNIKIEFTNERIIPASGLAVVGAILGKSDFVKHCNPRRIWMWNGFRQGNLIPMNWYLNLPYWRTIYFGSWD